MGAGADVYKPVTDILHQWLSISRISTQYIQIEAYASHSHRNKCLLQRFFTSTVFFRTVKKYVAIMN